MLTRDTLKGIGWMVTAMAGFALEDVFIKATSGHIPTSEVLFLIGAVGALAFAVLCRSRGEAIFPRAALHPAFLIRTACETLGTCCFVTALVLLPMAPVVAIFQSIPLVVTFAAALFLGAQVGWRRWSAILVGFLGVLIIIRPGGADFEPAFLLVVAATLIQATRDILTGFVPKGISSYQVALYGFVAVALSGVLLAPFWGAPVLPPLNVSIMLGCAVLVGMLAYYALTEASRIGDISMITPFRYTRILFATCLGLLVFAEVPDQWTYVGAALILGSGVYTFWRERRAPSRPLSSSSNARYQARES